MPTWKRVHAVIFNQLLSVGHTNQLQTLSNLLNPSTSCLYIPWSSISSRCLALWCRCPLRPALAYLCCSNPVTPPHCHQKDAMRYGHMFFGLLKGKMRTASEQWHCTGSKVWVSSLESSKSSTARPDTDEDHYART